MGTGAFVQAARDDVLRIKDFVHRVLPVDCVDWMHDVVTDLAQRDHIILVFVCMYLVFTIIHHIHTNMHTYTHALSLISSLPCSTMTITLFDCIFSCIVTDGIAPIVFSILVDNLYPVILRLVLYIAFCEFSIYISAVFGLLSILHMADFTWMAFTGDDDEDLKFCVDFESSITI